MILDGLIFVDYQPTDLVLLPGAQVYHAVMPLVPEDSDGPQPQRHSVVLFADKLKVATASAPQPSPTVATAPSRPRRRGPS